MRSYAKTAAFFRNAGQTPAFADGRVLALHHASGPHDVHYPTWEMHPEGDELLILLSGSLSVELREEETERTAPLSPQAALVVPAGVWHRVIVHEPSVLIAVTPCHNTVHEKG
jgi:mannose-6-phosphate isomerase-like protein (cupin superfamily)